MIRTTANTRRGLVWDIRRLRDFYGLKIGQIPFLQTIMWSSDTASRSWVGEVDGAKQYLLDGSNVNLAAQGDWPNVKHPRQFFGQAATDLSPQITPVNMAIRRQMAIDLGPNDFAGLFTFYFLPIVGTFLPDTDIVERLSARRKMDRWDSITDSSQGTFRTGKVRQMGDASPGT